MALVTEALLNLLCRQIEARGTVVWFDPEQTYLELAQSLESKTVAQATVHHYDPERGFVWLRRQLESLWQDRTTLRDWLSTCPRHSPRRTTR